jgi:hypothetical protein
MILAGAVYKYVADKRPYQVIQGNYDETEDQLIA